MTINEYIHSLGIRLKNPKFTKIILSKTNKDGKDVTIIFWEDGTKTKLVKNKDDLDSILHAVSIGHMIKRYGSNSAYKSYIRRMLNVHPAGYEVVAVYETAKIYGGVADLKERIYEKIEYNTSNKERKNEQSDI